MAGRTLEICRQTALQQGLVSLTLIFVDLGGAMSAFVGTYLGRRGTIQVGAALLLVVLVVCSVPQVISPII